VEKIDRSMIAVEQKLPQILEKAITTMDHLDQTSRNLEITADKALPKVPILLNSVEGTLQEADTVIDAVKDIWPLKSHLPEKREIEFVPGDSHE
jgi:uncharacterized protein YoxC